MNTENSKKLLYYLIIIIIIMSILCYFVNLESFADDNKSSIKRGDNNKSSKKRGVNIKPSKKRGDGEPSRKKSDSVKPSRKKGDDNKPSIKKGGEKKSSRSKSGDKPKSKGKRKGKGKGKLTRNMIGDEDDEDDEDVDAARTAADSAKSTLDAALLRASQNGLIYQREFNKTYPGDTKIKLFDTSLIRTKEQIEMDKTTPRHMKVPKKQIKLSADKSTHIFTVDGTKQNIEEPTTTLRCWNNEIIANIKDEGSHYEFDCYTKPGTSITPSPWICHAGDNWSDGTAVIPYKKNEDGIVVCGSRLGDDGCQSYSSLAECNTAATNKTSPPTPSQTYMCIDEDGGVHSNYGTNKWHWCSRLYEDLTKSGY